MPSQIELRAASDAINQSGALGSKTVIIPDDDKIVVAADMKVGTYTKAADPTSRCILGVTVTATGTADTMGTITITGTCDGVPVSDVVTPIDGKTVYTTKEFDTVTSVVGAGWVVDAGSQADKIKVGQAYSAPGAGQFFSAIMAVATGTKVSVQTDVSGATVAGLTGIAALPTGVVIPCKCSALAISAGEAIAYLGKL